MTAPTTQTITTATQGEWTITRSGDRIDIHNQHGEWMGVFVAEPMVLAQHVAIGLAKLAELRQRIAAEIVSAERRDAYGCANAMKALLRNKPVSAVNESVSEGTGS